MPIAPGNAKPTRPTLDTTTSNYYSKKRSASPSSNAHAESSRSKSNMQASSSTPPAVPKRADESVYFEEDYREEVLSYMTAMDVSRIATKVYLELR
jgi:hypothetical protein